MGTQCSFLWKLNIIKAAHKSKVATAEASKLRFSGPLLDILDIY